ncbi:hypothetical protein CCACVL1_03700 [Corchorus capsularis]|uniref:Cyclic nucleotide-binding domain-containing protein n=1 Tax=Corchorus capsularis TaxID=210143 RepID=A0A1R3JXV6_COCAP|nr:hypothetical protein CCACVL1_03700 [Corchorus capsularis]
MEYPPEKTVRFQDWKSEKRTEGHYSNSRINSGRIRFAINSFSEKFQRGVESGSERIKGMRKSLKSSSFNRVVAKGFGSSTKVLDPQGSFLQRWNKIFVLSCIIAVSIDPLFFYIPIINDDKKCLALDEKMETTASVLRSFTDIFYIIHIIFQFRTGFIAPSSRVFGRGVLVEDSWEIAKRYLQSYFLIDILAVLPLPQEDFYLLLFGMNFPLQSLILRLFFLFFPLIFKVPMFEKMDEQLLDAMCDCLKPVLYTEESYIVREGDPVDEMLFIMRGKLLTMTTNGGRTGFFNSEYLGAGDFCGEELLTWALDPHSSSNLPISTRTVRALTEVEAFALMADDLKFVASQFRRLHSKQLRHTFRFYSQQWRTWAACFIQAAWRRYSKKKLEESLREEENRLQDALANAGGSSPSLGATIYASRFAANALRALRRNKTRKARVAERVPPILLQKPAEPDFTAEEQ